ncbi:MAG: Glycosyl transferase, group 1 family protein, partial [uncultured Phycisphaerae bacterium]
MRITMFVGRADLSGGQRVIHIYAQKLQERGHEVLVIARPPRRPTLRERLRWKLLKKPLPAAARPSASYFDAAEHPRDYTFRYLDEYRPATAADVPDADVVVATWWETAEWVKTFPASKGAKAYFIQHYEAFAGGEARVDATWRLPMHKICVAQWLVDIAHKRFSDLSAELVANAVDLEQFTAGPRGKQPVPTVGVMYSPIPFKGCDVSLKAYEIARRQVPELKLIAFGAIDPQASLPLPDGAEFRFQPPQDELRDYYGRCDAWLFGSRSEGFGLPLLEAMACRTPVIATPAGAAPELVARGGGVLVLMEDPEAMAEAILRVVRT